MDIAELGIRVDAQGAITQVRELTRESNALATAATKVESTAQKEATSLKAVATQAQAVDRIMQRLVTNEMNDLIKAGQKVDASNQRQVASFNAMARATRTSIIENGASAGQIAALDRITQKYGTAVQVSTFNVGKLRGAFTSLAASAGVLPGSLGRVASALAPMAVGGAVTVGVLAGLSAIGFAYDKLTEKARVSAEKQKESIDRLRTLYRQQELGPLGETGVDVVTAQTRLTTIMTRLRGLRNEIAFSSGAEGDGTTRAQTNRLIAERHKLVSEANQIVQAISAGEVELTRIMREEAEKRFEIYRREAAALRARGGYVILRPRTDADRAYVDEQRGWTGNAPVWSPDMTWRPSAGTEFDVNARRPVRPRSLTWANSGIDPFLRNYGLNFAANRAGPFGSMVAGVGAGVASSNPYLAAAGGVTGLIDAIIGLGRASRESRREMQAFLTEQDLAIGDVTPAELERKRILEGNARARGVIEAERDAHLRGLGYGSSSGYARDAIMREYQKRIETLNDKERRRLEQLEKEASTLERINSAVRNAPDGFYSERYQARLHFGPVLSSTGSTPSGKGVSGHRTVVIQDGAIRINADKTPMETARAVVHALDVYASATGGAGSSRTAALEQM